MLRDAQIARSAGNLEEALNLLKSLVGMQSKSVDGWKNLAEIQELMGKWREASSSWESAASVAHDTSIRRQYFERHQKAVDKQAIIILTQAEEFAQHGDFSKSLTTLLDAIANKPSPRTIDRIQDRYFKFLGMWFRAEILNHVDSGNWKSIAVATFLSNTGDEGHAVRDRVCAALHKQRKIKTFIVSLSENAISALQRGEPEHIPREDQDKITRLGADAVVFGSIHRQLQAYVYVLNSREIHPLLSVTPITRVPGLPNNIEAWFKLPVKHSTNRGLRVEVWTERTQYTIGDEVVFHLRSTQDCYVTLIDLQTSGGLYILFPNSYHADNFVKADITYTIPMSNWPFTINAGQPPGIEGVKVIATKNRLSLPQIGQGEIFVVTRTPALQTELSKAITSSLRQMQNDEWDIAEWTFEIKSR